MYTPDFQSLRFIERIPVCRSFALLPLNLGLGRLRFKYEPGDITWSFTRNKTLSNYW